MVKQNADFEKIKTLSLPSLGISLGLSLMSFVHSPVSLYREESDERRMRKEGRRREQLIGVERR